MMSNLFGRVESQGCGVVGVDKNLERGALGCEASRWRGNGKKWEDDISA